MVNTSKKIDLSIIVPVYNVAPYITECLSSIGRIKSEYSIECILIDDCGSDNSMTLSSDFISSYNGHISFSILHHTCNKGLSAARNTGMNAAQGSYLLFVDSDDLINPRKFEIFLDKGIESDVDIVIGDYLESDGTKTRLHTLTDNILVSNTILKAQSFFESYAVQIRSVVWRSLFKRSFLLNNKLKFHEGILFEDIEFTPYAYHHAASVIWIPIAFYIYRRRDSSITKSNPSLKKVLDSITILTKLKELSTLTKNHNLGNIYYNYGFYLFLKQYAIYGKRIGKDATKQIITCPPPRNESIKIVFFWYLLKNLPEKIILIILKILKHFNKFT